MTERRCPQCGHEVADGSSFCPSCGQPLADSTDVPTRTALEESGVPGALAPRTASSSSDGGRFLPGQVLDERYRIIGLLGRGGMGEVYRADDLKLGQPVALKFLPPDLAQDAGRLERFFNEARTARQVTHPNVCRVFDLGEVEGQHFISMEYVDGEDLGTLLRRIGHVPEAKATQIARQLCAGLEAAHEEGILHRDLKPANIMLDGRGRVRITDFGLAGLAEEMQAHDVRAGTPAYQAPEQLSGKEVTKASDIYSLGLVLYELFTGKRAFEATSAAELRQKQVETTPPSLSSHVSGLDDSIERIIQRCLSPQPASRPESPLAISAALPGGDPLVAALAAGETPSPEMVANAGVVGGLRPWVAISLLAVVFLSVGIDYAYRTRYSTLAQIGLPKSHTELRVRARQILDELGYDQPAVDTAWALNGDNNYYNWVRANDPSPDRWSALPDVKPRPYHLWYRESPEYLAKKGFFSLVWTDSPPPTEPGSVNVIIDSEGRLQELRVVPPRTHEPESTPGVDWAQPLEWSGIDLASLTEVEPISNPPFNCGQQRAWKGLYPDQLNIEIRIEACSASGRHAYFEVMPPWNPRLVEHDGDDVAPRQDPAILIAVAFSLFLAVLVGAALLARRNLRLGRADVQGAKRLAFFLAAVNLLGNLLEANHGPIADEFPFLLEILALAAWNGMVGWTLYIAVEPFIRRVWPQTIISWRRLLDGRFRDPLVGRDILIGSALSLLTIVARIGFHLNADPPELISGGDLLFVSGFKRWAFQMHSMLDSFFGALVITTAVVLVRILLRRDWLTGVALTALMVTLLTFASDGPLTNAIFFTMIWGSVFLLAIRFGLLALVAGGSLVAIDDFVRVWDPSAWYFPYILAGLALLLVVPIYGFFVSLGGRQLFKADLLDS